MKLFRAIAITRKIILEGGLVVVDGIGGDEAVSNSSGGSGVVVSANDVPLTVLKTNHYEYDHTGVTTQNHLPGRTRLGKGPKFPFKQPSLRRARQLNDAVLRLRLKLAITSYPSVGFEQILYRWKAYQIYQDRNYASLDMPYSSNYEGTLRGLINGYTDFVSPSECSACECQDCKFEQHVDVIMYYLRKKYKNKNFSINRYTTTDCFFKVYIDKAYVNYYEADVGKDLTTRDASAKTDEVADMEMSFINTIKGLSPRAGQP
ncbi:hypothetical protein CQW23_12385 [Capsicum baccatum]|uniref:Uncharacterized protein n=1 Tax=Capsicum baccatum TaxID=33114 RepID=A0A2G2WSG0_CAPBA|nr:hypothetical protein CQW23_12385 [Capsicum baccatum]